MTKSMPGDDDDLPEGYHQMTNYGRARWHASQAQMHADRARRSVRFARVAAVFNVLANLALALFIWLVLL